MFRRTALLPMLAGALALSACSDFPTANPTQANLTVQLTDAPSEYLAAAEVTIGRIEILPVNGPGFTVVEAAGTYDLLQLQNGVTADLASITVDAGNYRSLRMIVESARVTLRDGYTFTDGSQTKEIAVPSGAQTGIKISLDAADGSEGAGVEIRPGETILVIDFDVSQNFVMQGSADTEAGIQGFNFTPTLRGVVRDVAGSISGTVAAPEGMDVKDLAVIATRDGAPEGEAPASTLVREDGTFQVHFLAPGTYSVTLASVPDGFTVNTVADVVVGESQDVTGVALTIAAAE